MKISLFWRPHFILLISGCIGLLIAQVFLLPFDQIVSFFLGVAWVSLLFHPRTKEHTSQPSYRFSLVRMFYLLDQKIISSFSLKIPWWFQNSLRLLPPILLSAFLYSFSGQGSPLLCGAGAFLAFILHQVFLKPS